MAIDLGLHGQDCGHRFFGPHAQVHNHFNHERHLITRQVYKQRRSVTLAEWRALAA